MVTLTQNQYDLLVHAAMVAKDAHTHGARSPYDIPDILQAAQTAMDIHKEIQAARHKPNRQP